MELRASRQRDWTILVLIAVNLLAIIGAVFFDWKWQAIVVAFWFETLVSGCFTILKMIYEHSYADKRFSARAIFGKLLAVIIFIIFLASFMYLDLLLLSLLMFYDPSFHRMTAEYLIQSMDHLAGLLPFVLALFFIHSFSFVFNYVQKGEYKLISPVTILQMSLRRILFLQGGLLIFLALIRLFWSDVFLMSIQFAIMIVLIKLTLDIKSHKIEHEKNAQFQIKVV